MHGPLNVKFVIHSSDLKVATRVQPDQQFRSGPWEKTTFPLSDRMVYCTATSLWKHKYGHFNLFTSNKDIISQNIRIIDKVWCPQSTIPDPFHWE